MVGLMRTHHLALTLLGSLFLLGCPSASSLTSARTLDEGQLQFVIAPNLMGLGVSSEEGTAVPFIPMVEGQFRYGISDHVELGGKLWFGGFAGHMKFGLVRPESADTGFNLSLDPGLSYTGVSVNDAVVGAVYVYLPVVMGFRFGSGHELTIGPRLVPVFGGVSTSDGGSAGNALLAGSSLGGSFKLGSLRLMPEFSLLADTRPEPGAQRAVFSQFSLGFAFGG